MSLIRDFRGYVQINTILHRGDPSKGGNEGSEVDTLKSYNNPLHQRKLSKDTINTNHTLQKVQLGNKDNFVCNHCL